MCKNVIMIGAGGHAKVIADIIIKSKDRFIGFLDDHIEKGTKILGFDVLGKIADVNQYLDCEFMIGIGDNYIRKEIAEKFPQIKYGKAIHTTATIGANVQIGEGTVVMANAVINTCTNIGKHCIINTSAVIEHDNVICDYVHISPRATLGGTVEIGELTHVRIGTTITNNIKITKNTIIGAGAVVVKDIVESGTYIGVPAKKFA